MSSINRVLRNLSTETSNPSSHPANRRTCPMSAAATLSAAAAAAAAIGCGFESPARYPPPNYPTSSDPYHSLSQQQQQQATPTMWTQAPNPARPNPSATAMFAQKIHDYYYNHGQHHHHQQQPTSFPSSNGQQGQQWSIGDWQLQWQDLTAGKTPLGGHAGWQGSCMAKAAGKQ